MPDEALADELRDLGRRLDVAAAPDPAAMASAVRRRVAHRGERPGADTAGRGGRPRSVAAGRGGRPWAAGRRRGPAPWAPRPRPIATSAAAVLVAFAVLLAGSTQVRAAVVDFFRFAGVIVERGDTTPGPGPAAPSGTGVADVEAARELVDFPVVEPADLGPPDEVSVTDGRVVSLVYKGIRLDQFDGTLDPAFAKSIPDPNAVEWTEVDGASALWLRGPHGIVYVDRAGVRRTESSRTAGATLVWQRGAVTVRLEGAATMADAITIAESLR